MTTTFAEPATLILPEPELVWRWTGLGLGGGWLPLRRRQVGPLLAGLDKQLPWVTFKAGTGDESRFAQALGSPARLQLEVSQPRGWCSTVTRSGVPLGRLTTVGVGRDVSRVRESQVLGAPEAAAISIAWLSTRELLPGYVLIEVVED